MLYIEIIYEDENFLAVNKPSGLLVHGVRGVDSDEETLVDWILKNRPEVGGVGDDPEMRPGIVHRLDKDTSGVILIAKNQKYFDYLKNLFQDHKIQKTYLALTYGKIKPEVGVIKKPIGIKSGTIKRSVHSDKFAKEAITEYKVKKYLEIGSEDFSLVEAMPKTGRTHQIRVHLASLGYPIVGDEIYGHKKTDLVHRHFLHAESVEFNLSEGKRIKISAELPEDLAGVLSGVDFPKS